jgi:hypothetical protein
VLARHLSDDDWDAVLDVATFLPRVVRLSVEALVGRVGRYVYVSSISAYASTAKPDLDETAAVGLYAETGSRHEPARLNGIAHLFEHMMFKGTPTTGPEEYSRIIAKNGGQTNAFTTADVTVYFATMSRDKIHIPLELEAGMAADEVVDHLPDALVRHVGERLCVICGSAACRFC